MAELKRVNTMTPFLMLKPDEFWLVRVMDRGMVDIRGEKRDCLTLGVYYTGRGPIPNVETLMPSFNNTPSPVLIGTHKAIADGMELDTKNPTLTPKIRGSFWVLRYNGQKSLGGARKFNQWEMFELSLSEAELKAFRVEPLLASAGKKL